MIDGWRAAWKKDFPFYFVQIAPFRYKAKNTGALLREAQLQSAAHHKTGMVVITDLVADTNDVHPANKHDVGLRLANLALAGTYHRRGIPFKAPFSATCASGGNKAVITFNHAGKGLMLKGTTATEWMIAGEDKIFYPAEAVWCMSIRRQCRAKW